MIKIIGVVGIDVYLSDGEKVSARDFINTPKTGYGVEMLDDIGYQAIPIGDDMECTTCGLDNIGV